VLSGLTVLWDNVNITRICVIYTSTHGDAIIISQSSSANLIMIHSPLSTQRLFYMFVYSKPSDIFHSLDSYIHQDGAPHHATDLWALWSKTSKASQHRRSYVHLLFRARRRKWFWSWGRYRMFNGYQRTQERSIANKIHTLHMKWPLSTRTLQTRMVWFLISVPTSYQ